MSFTEQSVADVNCVASFLANEQVHASAILSEPRDCIVLCGSAILNCALVVFEALERNPHIARTLVVCGGHGHSTSKLWQAIEESPRFGGESVSFRGQAESDVLLTLFEDHFDYRRISATCEILQDDISTNCGANALEAKLVLEHCGILPEKILVVQDPTMSLRTAASFKKAYADSMDPPDIFCMPTFVPRVELSNGTLRFVKNTSVQESIWPMHRFMNLILGEIPRLRDDTNGYGPNGKKFITHVDVPMKVLEAWQRLMAGPKVLSPDIEAEKDASRASEVDLLAVTAKEGLLHDDAVKSGKGNQDETELEDIAIDNRGPGTPESQEITSGRGRLNKSEIGNHSSDPAPIDIVEDEEADADESDDLYVINRIVDHRKTRKQYEYRIRWEGYGPDDDTWEPHESLLESASAVLKAYWSLKGGYKAFAVSPAPAANKRKRQSKGNSTPEKLPASASKKQKEETRRDTSATTVSRVQSTGRGNAQNDESESSKLIGDVDTDATGQSRPVTTNQAKAVTTSQAKPLVNNNQPKSTTNEPGPVAAILQKPATASLSKPAATIQPRHVVSKPTQVLAHTVAAANSHPIALIPEKIIPQHAQQNVNLPRRAPPEHNQPASKSAWKVPLELINWDAHAKVLGLSHQNGEWLVNVEWKDAGNLSLHSLSTVYKKMPQSMLQFYEKHLVVKD